jgi:hypothetical protein
MELEKRVVPKNGPYQVNPNGLSAPNRKVLYLEAMCLQNELMKIRL